jgi:lysophospholipase L1-like esterase
MNRRRFIGQSTLLLAGSSYGCASLGTFIARSLGGSVISESNVVLFQGDSITAEGRSTEAAASPNEPRALGTGYAGRAAATVLAKRPNDALRFFNRGVSGDKIVQLAARWDRDCIALKPDVVSVLIGVNDFFYQLTGQYDGTAATFERDYNALLVRTRSALPNVKLVIGEPFALKTGNVDSRWFPGFDEYRQAVRRVATAQLAVFVPYHSMFEEAIKQHPASYWASDGIHPTAAGAAMMAEKWVEAVG